MCEQSAFIFKKLLELHLIFAALTDKVNFNSDYKL